MSDFESGNESDYLDQVDARRVADTKVSPDARYNHLIDEIRNAFEREPTGKIQSVSILNQHLTYHAEFELLALSALPLPPDPSRYLRNREGVKLRCCKKALQILLDCQINENIDCLHAAGSLLKIVPERPAPFYSNFYTMSSSPSGSQEMSHPNPSNTTLSNAHNLLEGTPSLMDPSNGIGGLAARTTNRRSTVGYDPTKTSYLPHLHGQTTSPLPYPSADSGLGDHLSSHHPPSFGAATQMNPSPAKRAFSSRYPNSNSMTWSEVESTPSPKRRGRRNGSIKRNMIDDTANEAYLASAERAGSGTETHVDNGAQSNPTGFRGQIAANHILEVDEQENVPEYSKYYLYLAEKNGMKLEQPLNGDGVPHEPHSSPYTPVTPFGILNVSTSTDMLAATTTPTRHSDRYQNTTQQMGASQSHRMYGGTDRSLPRMQQIEETQQRNPRQPIYLPRSKQKLANLYPETTIQPDSAVSHSTVNPFYSNLQASQYQPVPSYMPPNAPQNALLPQNSYDAFPKLELYKQLMEEKRLKDKPRSNTNSSIDSLAHASAHNQPTYTDPLQGQQPDNQHYPGVPFAGRPVLLGDVQPYLSVSGRSNTEPLFLDKVSSPPAPAPYATDQQQHNSFDPNSPPVYPQVSGESGSKLESRSKVHDQKSRILTDDASPEGCSHDSLYPEPPADCHSEGTTTTELLPNINQPYTGTPADYRPFDPSGFPDGPIRLPPIPSHLTDNPFDIYPRPKPKKKTPQWKIVKRSTPRKSRANKSPLISEEPIIPKPTLPKHVTPEPIFEGTIIPQPTTPPLAHTPQTVTPRPPIFNFSNPAGHLANQATLSNMMSGNYSEFFKSAEEEKKWKEDAVAQAMAEIGTPSKYQLKKEEAERKRLEKELKKGGK
ncbi:hypothetical protein VTL71DRAFT_526 [Oculimacula yallundae]|uniref:Uncharacterized protein n=1 Tax=Oculimacula yallundae TaxID=86028 RepID=A0ABR4D0B2_9HELO